MRRELQEDTHPDLASGINNLGFALLQIGEYNEAEALFREALAMKRKLLGDEHPEIAIGLNNVAYVLHMQGDYDAAEPMLIHRAHRHAEELARWATPGPPVARRSRLDE